MSLISLIEEIGSEIPYQVAEDCIRGAEKQSVKIDGVEIVAYTRGGQTIDSGSIVDARFYASSEDRGWFIDSESSKHPDFIELRSFPFSFDIPDYLYVYQSDTFTAKERPDPISRPDKTFNVSSITMINSGIPFEWTGETEDREEFYLRYRSGGMEARVDGDVIFEAFIGGEFPGTNLNSNEILSIIDSLEFVNLPD
jgi:hypothetical protein